MLSAISCIRQRASTATAQHLIASRHIFRLTTNNKQQRLSTSSAPKPEVSQDTPNTVEWKLRGGKKSGRNFIDRMRCTATGGHGGDGCVSFFRDVFVPRGPPNGGDGGSGGSVWFEVDENETSLSCVKQQLRAQPGGNGRGKTMHGSGGSDLVVKVPRGTMVRQITNTQELAQEQKEEGFLDTLDNQIRDETTRRMMEKKALFVHYPRWEDRNDLKQVRVPAEVRAHLWALRHGEPLTADLTTHGQRVLVAGGGLGGLGNPHFNSANDRQPHYALRGLSGHTRLLDLELKTIADVGLVGMPNAGKSTFLRAVSNAHPQVAPYPFTTLNPYIGTVDYSDSWQLTIADIPGLIPGAHRNIGLGHSFLRHVERSRLLVFVVDVARPAPWADYQALRTELELYRPGLTERPAVVVANKADAGPMARDNFTRWQRMISDGTPLVPVSAKYRKNILKATHTIRQVLVAADNNTH
ncbi:GTPase of the mitochondrial inner membrane that associates with the large ribosomal subunit [Coemansia sp. RSA 1722]|nr:GTPase of the mitochondrial inner membrane that associates with the large ribosomal subunit [Coemansia sp. RSA 485]KAJ2594853.1 GTPase of the mitochondrial inner membrane that associates with the large ribosomal subunit [Coemansia sp. RSA 1722]